MKFLVDTNILIPLEPTREADVVALTEPAAKLLNLILKSGYQLYIHPRTTTDLQRDRDIQRHKVRSLLLGKYPSLPDPPGIPHDLEAALGPASDGSNDWVDHHLLSALYLDAVDFLVTEDREIHRKAKRIQIADRVLSITEAVGVVSDLAERAVSPPPAVRAIKAHAIDPQDPILDSFRADYREFDEWFKKCRREHRQAWVIEDSDHKVAAFCIIKKEDSPTEHLSGKVLKLCSFKVSDDRSGNRFGELLLKAVFEHSFENQYEWLFVTVFPKYNKLIELFEEFGFSKTSTRTILGELILVKPLRATPHFAETDPLRYHIRHGPQRFLLTEAWYLVPILPRYAAILFPEASAQATLFPGKHPFGNAIRKAYLCHSPVRSISPGSLLLFYRSRTDRGIIAIGVTERTLVSSSSEEIAREVAMRTVYSLREIAELCKVPVLALLFRQARIVKPLIGVKDLRRGGVITHPPQSITEVRGGALSWIQKRLAL